MQKLSLEGAVSCSYSTFHQALDAMPEARQESSEGLACVKEVLRSNGNELEFGARGGTYCGARALPAGSMSAEHEQPADRAGSSRRTV
jgi:hypothetical protein